MKRISDSPCMHTNLNKYLGNFQPIRQSGCKIGLRKFKKTYDSVEFLEMGRDRNQETLAISWPQLYTRPQQRPRRPGKRRRPQRRARSTGRAASEERRRLGRILEARASGGEAPLQRVK